MPVQFSAAQPLFTLRYAGTRLPAQLVMHADAHMRAACCLAPFASAKHSVDGDWLVMAAPLVECTC